MLKNISIGVDIGTTTTRVVVGEFVKGDANPKIIGVGEAETRGMRHGYVLNIDEVTASLNKAKEIAERSSGVKIKRAYIGIGGSTLKGETVTGTSVISKSDGEVTALDINKALENCEENINLLNKKVIKVLPISFKLDGNEILGRPEGMKGTKLEVKAIFITCTLSHFEDLLEVIDNAGIDPIDVIANSLAGARIVTSAKQKMVGCAVVNIGGETTSLSVFENNTLIALNSFPIGGGDITNDIALGLKVSLESAEASKLGTIGEDFSKRKLDEIVEARLSDIFEVIEKDLKKIKRNELLPAGIIWIGGGAEINMLEECSKKTLNLPSKVGTTDMFGNIKTKLRDPVWFPVLGLILPDDESTTYGDNSFVSAFGALKKALMANIKELMP